jgi:hypothetical protein
MGLGLILCLSLILLPAICAYLVVRRLGSSIMARKWLQNDSVFFLFWPTAFPAALALFLDVVKDGTVFAAAEKLTITFLLTSAFVVLLALLIHLNFSDENGVRRIFPPYYYDNSVELAELHERLLKGVAGMDRKREAVRKEAVKRLIDTYTSQSGAFRSASDLLRRSSTIGVLQFVMSIFVDTFGLLFLWYLCLISLTGSHLSDRDWTKLVWALLLLILWAPTRLYTEWYRHLKSLEVDDSPGNIRACAIGSPGSFHGLFLLVYI